MLETLVLLPSHLLTRTFPSRMRLLRGPSLGFMATFSWSGGGECACPSYLEPEPQIFVTQTARPPAGLHGRFLWGETRGGGVPPPQMSAFPMVRSHRPVICGRFGGTGLDRWAESSPRVRRPPGDIPFARASGRWTPGTVLGEGLRLTVTETEVPPWWAPPTSVGPLRPPPRPLPCAVLPPSASCSSRGRAGRFGSGHHPSCRASPWGPGQQMEGPLTAPPLGTETAPQHGFLEPEWWAVMARGTSQGPAATFPNSGGLGRPGWVQNDSPSIS